VNIYSYKIQRNPTGGQSCFSDFPNRAQSHPHYALERVGRLFSKPTHKRQCLKIYRLVIKTFEKTRDQDQDFSHLVLRPRPWSPGLKIKTKVN